MPLRGARGGSPAGGRGRGRRGGNNNGRVVTVYKNESGIYKPRGNASGGYQNGNARTNTGGRRGRGRGGNRGRQGSSGRGRGRGGRGDRGPLAPSFLPEGKKFNDLTDAEKDDVRRQQSEWKAAQLDKDLVSYMAKNGKVDGAKSMLDDDLEAYRKAGNQQKQNAQPVTEQPQDGAEAMES